MLVQYDADDLLWGGGGSVLFPYVLNNFISWRCFENHVIYIYPLKLRNPVLLRI
jgi:hypothetical protein